MILSITLNPCVDRTLFVDTLTANDANRVLRSETDAGGKGVNAARVIAELGVPVIATGFLGAGNGRIVEEVLNREEVDSDFIPVSGETRLNINVEDGSGKPPTTFNGAGPTVVQADLDKFFELFSNHIADCKFVTAGGSLPPGVSSDTYAKLVRVAKANGVPMVVDADGEALKMALAAEPFLVKPNVDEAERLLGDKPRTLEDGISAAKEICGLGAEVTIVSMGPLGAALVTEGTSLIVEAPKVDVKSTIGAGDSMIGGFLAALHRGKDFREALALGAAAGAATATTDGSEIARRSVIDEILPKVIIRQA